MASALRLWNFNTFKVQLHTCSNCTPLVTKQTSVSKRLPKSIVLFLHELLSCMADSQRQRAISLAIRNIKSSEHEIGFHLLLWPHIEEQNKRTWHVQSQREEPGEAFSTKVTQSKQCVLRPLMALVNSSFNHRPHVCTFLWAQVELRAAKHVQSDGV